MIHSWNLLVVLSKTRKMPGDDSFMESGLKNDSLVGEHIQIRYKFFGWANMGV